MFVYKITNLVNKKVYVGITTRTIAERYTEHCSRVNTLKHLHLYSSMGTYGINNFKIEEIDRANTLEELFEKEKYWIKYYKSSLTEFGYNNTAGGQDFNYIELNDNLIIERYLELRSSELVAIEFNCSSNTILRRLKSNGIETNRGYSDYSLKVIEMYKIPYTIKDICKILSLSNKTVMKILDENEIQRHTFFKSVPNMNEIIEDYNKNIKLTDLSQKYKIPRHRLSKLLYYRLKI